MARSPHLNDYASVLERDSRTRHLKSIVGSAQLLGGAFVAVGLFMMLIAFGGRRADPLMLVLAMSLASSGAAYIVFATFLRRRRYWAWVATLVMTILLLAAVSFLALWIVARALFESDPRILAIITIPVIGFGSWIAALALILYYLRESLPAVREQEAVVQKGFAVIPVAQVAPTETVPTSGSPNSSGA
jgi:hypothetical protein